MRRFLRCLPAIVLLFFSLTGRSQDHQRPARHLHQEALVFDAHCDTVMRLEDAGLDFSRRSDQGHLDIPRMVEGGLDAQVFALWVEPGYWPDHATRRTLQLADVVLGTIDKHADRLGLALSADDALALNRQGKIAIFLGIEGGHAIEDELSVLRMFHRLGVRVMTLTWMQNTNWADASGDKPRHGGLSPLGVRIVREMNRLGMVIDVSHVSDQTFDHVLRVTRKPVIASHSCCRALCDHHRNLTDDMLRALAANGGVIGINYFTGFLDRETLVLVEKTWKQMQPRLEKLRKQYAGDPVGYKRERRKLMRSYRKNAPRVPVDRLIDHLDHAVRVAGIDHVGLGSDFDGISLAPAGLEDVSRLPVITGKLLAKGYSSEDIRKILGGNLLRVFQQVMGE